MKGKTIDRVLDDLDTEQRRVAVAISGPVCIIAGAGTGKTRAVTHRLAYAVTSRAVAPDTALAVTHSRKAAAELKERLASLGIGGAVDARTFHAAALRVAGQFWSRTARAGSKPELLTGAEEWRVWREVLRRIIGADPGTAMVRDALDEVAWARSRLLGAESYPGAVMAADRHPGVSPPLVVDAWAGVEAEKLRLRRVDFADLLEIAARLLETDEEVAAKVRRRWAHVTVDEYQDTDPAQQRFLDAVLGGRRDVCVVGDPRQAIYSWKGADTTFLTGFIKRYPDAKVISLVRNYRSSPQILACANRIAVAEAGKPLVPSCPAGPAPTAKSFEDERAETRWVIGAVQRAIGAGTPLSEIAILYRFNAQQARFEAELARADVATTVAEDTTFFDREEIRQALALFGQSAAARGAASGLDLLGAALARTGFDSGAPPAGHGAVRARWESQRSLLDLVAAMPDGDAIDAATLHGELTKLAAHAHGPRTGGVTLATLHRAKGLEWDIVFIVGAVDGVLPASYADAPDALAEEERLVHVGVTRARHELHITWAAANAKGWANRESPYLEQMFPVAKVGQRKARQGSGPRTSHSGRMTIPRPSAECPHCSDALKGISARRLGVCANCVRSTPGPTGERARALAAIVGEAALRLGVAPEALLGPAALLRLLDARPATVEDLAGTAGVRSPYEWAAAAVEVLRG